MKFSRRETTGSLLCLALSLRPGITIAAARGPQTAANLTMHLQATLDDMIAPACRETTRLTVTTVNLRNSGSRLRPAVRLEAVVELRWPPGLRRRHFLYYGPDRDTAYAGLVERIVTEFARASPGCITYDASQAEN